LQRLRQGTDPHKVSQMGSTPIAATIKKMINKEKMEYVGNCTDENIVELIFGSVSEFARQVEENGDRFIYKNYIVVTYDVENDIHYFWKNKFKGY